MKLSKQQLQARIEALRHRRRVIQERHRIEDEWIVTEIQEYLEDLRILNNSKPVKKKAKK